MLQPISAESTLATALEQFVSAADAWLQVHYAGEADQADMDKMMDKIRHLAIDTSDLSHDLAYSDYCDREAVTVVEFELSLF